MEIKYIAFTCKGRHFLVQKSTVVESWPSIRDSNIENLVLHNGFQYRAENVKEFSLLDLSKCDPIRPVILDTPIEF